MEATVMLSLKAVDRVEVISLFDNVIDSMSDIRRKDVFRPAQWVNRNGFRTEELRAGHGLSFLVRLFIGKRKWEIIYDTGGSGQDLIHNINVMNIDMSNVVAIVISHGHGDHTGGLRTLLRELKTALDVHLHPRTTLRRRVRYETNSGIKYREIKPSPTLREITEAGGNPVMTTDPVLIANETVMLSGEVPRLTKQETGFIGHEILINSEWQDDKQVFDDRFIIINVRERGIVIITGCSHSGIINIIREAIRLTGIKRILGVLGGLHLAGKSNENRIPWTVTELRDHLPELIVPCHCTGWRAQHRISMEMGESYVNNGVGNMYVFH